MEPRSGYPKRVRYGSGVIRLRRQDLGDNLRFPGLRQRVALLCSDGPQLGNGQGAQLLLGQFPVLIGVSCRRRYESCSQRTMPTPVGLPSHRAMPRNTVEPVRNPTDSSRATSTSLPKFST